MQFIPVCIVIGTITVTVLPWIRTEDLTPENVPSLTEDVRSLMTSYLKNSAENVEKKPNGSTTIEKVQWLFCRLM